jgi:spermidine synthase
MDMRLLVNGIGMTALTPATKYMVHLPMAHHLGQPKNALIICFGMGTTFRAALSWGVDATVVELVPSVPTMFPFYHTDAAQVLSNPKGRIVIDDGRRFLQRAAGKYDIVVTDPPPPIEAAGSSLLYTPEFYALVKQHLNTNGILQSWIPSCRYDTAQSIIRSIHDSFPYVRLLVSIERVGTHLLASMQPIPDKTAAELAESMPTNARRDILEWSSTGNLTNDLQTVLTQEVAMPRVLNPDVHLAITDDQPYNEYFFLRDRHPQPQPGGH